MASTTDSFMEFKARDLGELLGQTSHFINKESEAPRYESERNSKSLSCVQPIVTPWTV